MRMSPPGGGRGGKSKSTPPSVSPTTLARTNVRGSEAKAAGALLSAVSSFDFDPNTFAVVLGMTEARMQNRLFAIFYRYFSYLAERFEEGLYLDDEEMELMANGARARDALKPFMDPE